MDDITHNNEEIILHDITNLTLTVLNSSQNTSNYICIFIFSFISQHWDVTGIGNLCLWKSRICLSCIVIILAADDLVTQGTKSLAVMRLTQLEYSSISNKKVNSLTPGRFKANFRWVISKLILVVNGWGISCETALIWVSLDHTYDMSTLVQVMAWCRQATSHYLSQCWPRSLPPYGIIRPQWVNTEQTRAKKQLWPQLKQCLIKHWDATVNLSIKFNLGGSGQTKALVCAACHYEISMQKTETCLVSGIGKPLTH